MTKEMTETKITEVKFSLSNKEIEQCICLNPEIMQYTGYKRTKLYFDWDLDTDDTGEQELTLQLKIVTAVVTLIELQEEVKGTDTEV